VSGASECLQALLDVAELETPKRKGWVVTGVLCNGVDACLQGLPWEFLSRDLTHLMLGASPALAFARSALKSAGHLVLDGVELRHLSVGARRVRMAFSHAVQVVSNRAARLVSLAREVLQELVAIVSELLVSSAIPDSDWCLRFISVRHYVEQVVSRRRHHVAIAVCSLHTLNTCTRHSSASASTAQSTLYPGYNHRTMFWENGMC
jgi:hypothetical protein